MITTVYKCDKCGNEQDAREQLYTIVVTAGTVWGQSYHKSIDVCRSCLESFGIYVTKKKEDEPRPQPPTIEELIREIIGRCSE